MISDIEMRRDEMNKLAMVCIPDYLRLPLLYLMRKISGGGRRL